MENQKRSFDGEVIHQLARLRTSWICQGAGTTHLSDIYVHPWPVEPMPDPMQGACHVEMPAAGVAVEGSKDIFSEVHWDKLKLVYDSEPTIGS
jgi:hypothetical protein